VVINRPGVGGGGFATDLEFKGFEAILEGFLSIPPIGGVAAESRYYPNP